MELSNIILEIKDNIGFIIINRPQKLNALTIKTIDELDFCIKELHKNSFVKAITITGAGDKAFVAGADIQELSVLNGKQATEVSLKSQKVFFEFEKCTKPVIALVNGFALGGGCELSMACHFRIASENAKFGQPEVNLGIIPGYGGTQRLTRLINSGRAMEYILTGDMIDANEALRIGLVNKVYPQAELMNKAMEMAKKIVSKGQQAIRLSVKAVNIVDEVSGKEGLNYEASLFSLACGTEDFKEGTKAFLEKRKPEFKNK